MSKLRLKTALGFSIGDIGGNLYFSLIGFIFIYYLTDFLGLSGTLAGLSMMIGKIWDAVTDPIVSSISDRSKSRFGRRRPFIFIGALLLALFMVLMFSIPQSLSTNIKFIIATTLFCLLSTAYTLVNIPYASLQPELTDNYNEQTKLTGMRMSFAIVGTILAVTARPLAESFGLENSGWTKMAIIMGFIMLISSWVTVFTVKEKTGKSLKKQKSLFLSYKDAFINREFILALIPWALFVSGVTIIQGAFLYYFKYIYFDNNSSELSLFGLLTITLPHFELSLFGLILVSLISLPLWVLISKRVNKHICYSLGMGYFALTLLAVFFLTNLVKPLLIVILLIISGIGFSTHYIMPHSLVPDIVELDYLRTGIRREGVYYSIWNFLMKVGQALAGLIIGITLDIVGFITPAEKNIVEQTQSTKNGIAFLCGPLPAIIILVGIFILLKYPITKKYYTDKLNEAN